MYDRDIPASNSQVKTKGESVIVRRLPQGQKSESVFYKGMAFLPGLAARNARTGASGKVRDVLQQLEENLPACGPNKEHLLSAQKSGSLILLTKRI
jgi:hypothetical protein